jgi:DNA-binding transcriptional LysR family regulator
MLDLDSCSVFVTLVRTGSFSKTAELLHMSQSTVSQRLHQLEEELGVALLRRGRELALTGAGAAFLPNALLLVEAEQKARADVHPFVTRVAGRVCVFASQTAGGYILPPVLSRFARSFPEVEVTLRIANSEEVVAAVAGGDADFGVVESPSTSQRLHQRAWLEDPLLFVARPDHPLVAAAPIDPMALSGVLLAVREPGSGTRSTLVEAWPRPLHESFRLLELGSLPAVRASVLGGDTVAFVSRWVVAEDLERGALTVRPTRTMRLVRRREPLPSRAVTELYDAVLRGADVADGLAKEGLRLRP